MISKIGKYLITTSFAICLTLTSIGSPETIRKNIEPGLLAANAQKDQSNSTQTNQQNTKKSDKQSSQSDKATSNTNNATLKNTGSKPDMPLMPLMPAMPSDAVDDIHSSVLNRPWEKKEQSINLKNQWENRRNSIWNKNNNKVITNIQKKKEAIHQKAKGKSSKTEVPVKDKK